MVTEIKVFEFTHSKYSSLSLLQLLYSDLHPTSLGSAQKAKEHRNTRMLGESSTDLALGTDSPQRIYPRPNSSSGGHGPQIASV